MDRFKKLTLFVPEARTVTSEGRGSGPGKIEGLWQEGPGVFAHRGDLLKAMAGAIREGWFRTGAPASCIVRAETQAREGGPQ